MITQNILTKIKLKNIFFKILINYGKIHFDGIKIKNIKINNNRSLATIVHIHVHIQSFFHIFQSTLSIDVRDLHLDKIQFLLGEKVLIKLKGIEKQRMIIIKEGIVKEEVDHDLEANINKNIIRRIVIKVDMIEVTEQDRDQKTKEKGIWKRERLKKLIWRLRLSIQVKSKRNIEML